MTQSMQVSQPYSLQRPDQISLPTPVRHALQFSMQGLTWRGQPSVQQDAMLVGTSVYQHDNGCTPEVQRDVPTIVAVADGLAHSPESQQASKKLLELVRQHWAQHRCPLDLPTLQEELSDSFRKKPELHGSACTLAAAVVMADRTVIQHVGDSRVYHWSAATRAWRQCTEDHSVIRRMIAEGDAPSSSAEDCGALYQGLDLCFVVDPLEQLPALRPQSLIPQAGDYLLLCTDGVHDLVPASEWPEPDQAVSLKAFLLQIRRQVYAASAYDNGTAVVVQFRARPSVMAVIPADILEEEWPPADADDPEFIAFIPERYRPCISVGQLQTIVDVVGLDSQAELVMAVKRFLLARRVDSAG